MGFGDIFKSKKNEELTARVAELEALLTPELRDHQRLTAEIQSKRVELDALERQLEEARERSAQELGKQSVELSNLLGRIQAARAELVETDEEVLMQTVGLYTPRFDFANSSLYKEQLASVRQQQKEMVKKGEAVTGNSGLSYEGSLKKGQKVVRDTQKLLLRAFNLECDDIVDRVRFNNIDASEKRILSAKAAISKLGEMLGIEVREAYVALKVNELHLAYEFQVKKNEEKERLRQLRAEERERAKLEREIEEARKKIEKEQKHYSNALQKVVQQLATAAPGESAALEAKKAELEGQLGELGKALEQVDYRAANQKAGYVYIISNIGAFGEGVYKIGMTRRLEPMDRVDELGDASVPFDFDVHALIFSENAPALEAALHHAFEDRKLNMVNTRREFFRVSLDEIKRVVRDNYDKTVEFVDVPPAAQYRESLLMVKNTHSV